MTAVCFPMLSATIDLLDGITPDAQLLQLKNLCISNGGIWTIPEDMPQGVKPYAPAFYEVSLFGVSASAADPEELPRNWMKAARAIVMGRADGCAA